MGVFQLAGRPGGHDKFGLSMLKVRPLGVTAAEHCAGHFDMLKEANAIHPISCGGKPRLSAVQ